MLSPTHCCPGVCGCACLHIRGTNAAHNFVVHPAGTTFYLTDVGGGPGAATTASRCDPATSQVTCQPNLCIHVSYSCCSRPRCHYPDRHPIPTVPSLSLSPYALSLSVRVQGPCVYYIAVTSAAPLTPQLVNRPPTFEIAARTPGTLLLASPSLALPFGLIPQYTPFATYSPSLSPSVSSIDVRIV